MATAQKRLELETGLKAKAGSAPALVLGIETSCDETAAAVVSSDRRILSNLVLSQLEEHRAFGGIVPEIAARAHLDHLDRLVRAALDDAGVGLAEIDAIAATAGPGLIGGVIVGLVTSKALALAAGKPLIAVNHLEGHALSARLIENIEFPYLLLLVSGGHCQLLAIEGVGAYRRLGTTIDDAAGEAFDKTAKLLGLGYPGGPAVETAAKGAADGAAARFQLPRPLLGTESCNFSFSGLKTAVRRAAEDLPEGADGAKYRAEDVAALAAAFQEAVGDCIVDRTARAMALFRESCNPSLKKTGSPRLVVAGGVAANEYLRSRLAHLSEAEEFVFSAPPQWLCTDNAAMIAWAGLERWREGLVSPLEVAARARWPLDEGADPEVGSGRKGVKV